MFVTVPIQLSRRAARPQTPAGTSSGRGRWRADGASQHSAGAPLAQPFGRAPYVVNTTEVVCSEAAAKFLAEPVAPRAVGSVVPVKGYDLLIAAVATLTDMPLRLTIAGDRTRNPAVAAQLDADIEAHGLGDRVAVLGAVPPERIVELYLASDVFVLASRFEGYGMALAEAIAHGLPVVSTMAGAIPDTVPAGTGLLVPPDDAAALAQALRRLISDRAERQRLAMGSFPLGKILPGFLPAQSRRSDERLSADCAPFPFPRYPPRRRRH